MDQTWTIVKFFEENTVEAVPSNWLVGNMCYWPPYSKDKLIISMKNYDEPNTCWPSLFTNGNFKSYLEARNKTKVAEYCSDLNDEDPKLRKFRKKVTGLSSDESSDEEHIGKLPPPPTKPKSKGASKPSLPTQNPAPLEVTGETSTNKENCNCCPVHRGTDVIDEHLQKIKKQYYLMCNILKDINTRLDNIKMPQNDGNKTDLLIMKFSFLPLNNTENLMTIEEYLGDPNNFKAASTELSKMGGNNIYEFVKRCMSQLFTNCFASTYSFHGRKNKKKFIGLKLSDLVIGAAEIFGGESTTKKIWRTVL